MNKEDPKRVLAVRIASLVKNNQTIGFGSGTTAEEIIREIGARVEREKFQVFAVSTSYASSSLSSSLGIRVIEMGANLKLDWAFDGADEVDSDGNMLKGRGACMLREKLVASIAPKLVIAIASEKKVSSLGKLPVPIEIIPSALSFCVDSIKKQGASSVVVRASNGKCGPLVTDNGNLVLDASFDSVSLELDKRLHFIPGVVETGLFFGFNPEVILA